MSFGQTYRRYWQNISALREFFERIYPFTKKAEDDKFYGEIRKLNALVGKEVVQASLKRIEDTLTQALHTLEETQEKQAKLNLDDGAGNKVFAMLLRFMRESQSRIQHPELLNRSVLVSLVGFYEVLLSDLLHTYYRLYPGAIGRSDKNATGKKQNTPEGAENGQEPNYSFSQIMEFRTIEEFKEYAIERKIEPFFRQSAPTWCKFFEEELLKLKRSDLISNEPQWFEYFQRRNIIVHNDARVSKLYLKNVAPEWVAQSKENLTLGSSVSVSQEYISGALDMFETVGAALCFECWKKFASDERKQREEQFVFHQYGRLQEGIWPVAEGLGRWALDRSDMSSSGMLIARINYWLAIKRQNRWSEIESAVKDFEQSALDPKFRLAIYALMKNEEEFFRLLPIAKSAGSISDEDLAEWPVLEEMRQLPEFKLATTGSNTVKSE